MKNYYIEQIKSYNDRISYFNLITRKIKTKWKIMFLVFIIFLSISIVLIIKEKYLLGVISLIVTLVLGINLFIVIKREEKRIIKKHYPYAFNLDGSYKPHFLLEIQKTELIHLLGDKLVTKKSLVFLIEKISNDSKKYSNKISTGALSIFIAILSGPFLSKFLNYATDVNDFLNASKPLILIAFFYTLLAVFIDIALVKPLVKEHEKNKNRLVATLENIYLEKYI